MLLQAAHTNPQNYLLLVVAPLLLLSTHVVPCSCALAGGAGGALLLGLLDGSLNCCLVLQHTKRIAVTTLDASHQSLHWCYSNADPTIEAKQSF
jgi:hypothetical protein